MNRLEGKVVVVTGGARGVGYEICRRFSEENPQAIYSLDMNPGGYRHEVVHNVQLNICDREALAGFAQRVREEQGRCDVIINNAAITRDGMLHKMTEDKWDAVIEVNLKGTFNVTQALVPFLLERALSVWYIPGPRNSISTGKKFVPIYWRLIMWRPKWRSRFRPRYWSR